MNKYRNDDGSPYTKEQFISKLKTDDEFSKQFGGNGIDQIKNLINDIKTNPDSRRLIVSAWNVDKIPSMTLPPCHYGFQIYTKELNLNERYELIKDNIITNEYDESKIMEYMDEHNVPKRYISLMWNQRSVDVGLGLPFNIASYALLLIMIAKEVNMIPDELICTLGNVHIYNNHIEPIKTQVTRNPLTLPTLKIINHDIKDISNYKIDDILIENYQYHSPIKFELSN